MNRGAEKMPPHRPGAARPARARQDDGRVLTTVGPAALPAEPTLEDGYLALMEGVR